MTGKKADPLESLQSLRHGWQIFLPAMFALLLVTQSCAYGQNPFAPKKKYNNDNEFVPETLKTPPDLPYLPPFSGIAPPVYGSMLCFKKKPDGPGYSVTFHVKDPPEDVISFYKNAFKNNRWDAQKNADSTKIVSGMRKGAVATVTVMKPIMPGYKTQVYIVYKISGSLQ